MKSREDKSATEARRKKTLKTTLYILAAVVMAHLMARLLLGLFRMLMEPTPEDFIGIVAVLQWSLAIEEAPGERRANRRMRTQRGVEQTLPEKEYFVVAGSAGVSPWPAPTLEGKCLFRLRVTYRQSRVWELLPRAASSSPRLAQRQARRPAALWLIPPKPTGWS